MTGARAPSGKTVSSVCSTPIPQPAVISRTNPASSAGFALLCIYALSGPANDWALHLFGTKAYLSMIAVALLPLAWLASGAAAFHGLRSRAGIWWAIFLLWMLLATPGSVWRGGSVTLLENYVPRAYLVFFYTTAFITTAARCRQWMYVQIAGAALLLMSCAAFGRSDGDPGRFQIPDSLFFANANDLALALLIGACWLGFLARRRGMIGKFFALIGITLAAYFALRTGSRGCLIAGCIALGAVVSISKHRAKSLAVALVLAAVIAAAAILGVSDNVLHRFALSDEAADAASLASGQERVELFRTSLRYTLQHPLLGVGPDQFATAVNLEAERANDHRPWLGTHNSYTQVSSECGLPALIAYVAVILCTLASSQRVYRHALDADIAAMGASVFATTVLFAAGAFFFHMAYSGYLPLLAGFAAALDRIVSRVAKPNNPREFVPRSPRPSASILY